MSVIRNPVLRGFNPDPSIVRVGGDYFLATSTFEWWPGVQLHHSRDLVHWRLAGHALTRESQLNLRGITDSGGVWAPSLSHADGKFWLIYTNVRTCGMGRPFKDVGIYLTTAPAIDGPWSEPIALNSIGFDPSLFHDDDGRKWLVNMMWDFRPGRNRFAGIVVQEYDPAARRLVGPMTRVLAKDILSEGPNLYKRDGWYYLMLAEGGTGWNHGIALARSRAITGPYELDPQPAVLTTRDAPGSPLQKAGHGELVSTPAGEWFLAHLAARPLVLGRVADAPRPPLDVHPADRATLRRCPLGRETCLQRVRWTDDGWLRLDNAPTADYRRSGKREFFATVVAENVSFSRPVSGETQTRSAPTTPALLVSAPRGVAPHPWPTPPTRDDFDAPQLDATWASLRGPIDESWASLAARPGWLRLRGRESLHSLFHQSLVAKRVTEHRAVARTRMEFRPEHFTQAAGLICYYDTRTHFYLRVTHDETRGRVLGIAVTDDGAYSELADAALDVNDWPAFHLQAEIDGTRLQFSASRDGTAWQPVGPVLDFSKLSDDYGSALHFTGAFVGICAQDLGGAGVTADFAHFELRCVRADE
ncbi:MAG: glycoside hydrolase family 43 protein [Opitutae bacterium]|nr:glycoside hydrolase family 43 protein [Opitutae bacterium]